MKNEPTLIEILEQFRNILTVENMKERMPELSHSEALLVHRGAETTILTIIQYIQMMEGEK